MLNFPFFQNWYIFVCDEDAIIGFRSNGADPFDAQYFYAKQHPNSETILNLLLFNTICNNTHLYNRLLHIHTITYSV